MKSSDEGLTLIELLVAVVILGIIVTVMSQAIILGLKTTDAMTQKVAESADTSLVTSYFVTDVQSAQDISTSDATCGGAPVVRSKWTDVGSPSAASDDITYIGAYLTQTVDGERQLIRVLCRQASGEPGFTETSRTPVIHNLSTTTAPQVICPVSCDGTPSSVTLTITEVDGFSFDLSASRRPQ